MAPSRGEEGEMAGEASSSSPSSGTSQHWKEQAIIVCNLWCAGFKDACCLHRAYLFCRRSRRVLLKTGQCFLLNGCIFLGSIVVLQRVVVPTLRWLLNAQLQSPSTSAAGSNGMFSDLLTNLLVGICYVFWLYPLYIISFIVNCMWYNEIAQHAFDTLDQGGTGSHSQPKIPAKGKAPGTPRSRSNNSAMASVVLGIGEQIYSVIMLSAFFVQVFVVSFIPYVGPLLNFVLLSWLYAYYCFDYKWGLARWSLEKRLLFFETNWAFFAGFGSPCVLATFFFSPFVSAGVMAVLFPLFSFYQYTGKIWSLFSRAYQFVLVATASNPEEAVSSCLGGNRDSGLRRLHLFYFANKLTLPLLRLLQPRSSVKSARKRAQ